MHGLVQICTILEDSCPIQLEASWMVGILVLLRVTHLVMCCVNALRAREADEG